MYNVGDRVQAVCPGNNYHGIKGKIVAVHGKEYIRSGSAYVDKYTIKWDNEDSASYWWDENDLKLINKSIITMLKQIPSTLKRVMNDDLQSRYKVGFINGDLALTDAGRNELFEILANEPAGTDYGAKLTTKAREIIAEAEKEENN